MKCSIEWIVLSSLFPLCPFPPLPLILSLSPHPLPPYFSLPFSSHILSLPSLPTSSLNCPPPTQTSSRSHCHSFPRMKSFTFLPGPLSLRQTHTLLCMDTLCFTYTDTVRWNPNECRRHSILILSPPIHDWVHNSARCQQSMPPSSTFLLLPLPPSLSSSSSAPMDISPSCVPLCCRFR